MLHLDKPIAYFELSELFELQKLYM